MKNAIKRMAIFTSGGDCPGLNAVIRGVVQRATYGYGWEVLGSEDGTQGMIDRPTRLIPLTPALMDANMLRQGGTMLGAYNTGVVLENAGELVKETILENGIDAMAIVGGDGSFSINTKLLDGVIPLVGIPKTIDNDLSGTEMSIGFRTAVDVATEALDRLHPTARSHHRTLILEVMGRDAGHIALESGIAGAADIILLPEIPWNAESVAKKIKAVYASGRTYAIIVVSEAAKDLSGSQMQRELSHGRKRYGGIGDYLAQIVTEKTGAEARCTVLGHVQRGCPPNAVDRMVGQLLGAHAVDLLAEGKTGRMVSWQNNGVTDVPMRETYSKYKTVDPSGTTVRLARSLGISFGDE